MPAPGRGSLRRFLAALVGHRPGRLAWVVVVQVASALTQGIGLLMLVPLLALAGVGDEGDGGPLLDAARRVFESIGLPLTLRSMLAAYVAVVAVFAGLAAYQAVLSARYRLEFVDSLRERAYQAIAHAEWRHLLARRSSDLLAALTVDVGMVTQGAMAALSLGVASVVVAVQLAVAVGISPAVTALAAVTGALLGVVVWPLVRRSRRLGRQLVVHNHGVLAAVTGFLDGLKPAKAHGLVDGHVGGFVEAVSGARRSQVDFARAQAVATAAQVVMTSVVLAVLVEVAVTRLDVPLPELLVLAFVFVRLVPRLTQAQAWVQVLAQALPGFESLEEVIRDCESARERCEDPPAPERRPGGVPARLALTDCVLLDRVSFSHRQPSGEEVDVLHEVTLELPAGATTALVGPSGAGKTTVADLALGLLRPTSGRVLVDGTPLAGDRIAAWRQSVAMVPQDPFLFHDTVRANLTWARPGATEAELWEALAAAAAADLVDGLPQGLDTVVGDRGGRLSGGQRQRVALARALLRRPELLVLDEATTSIDPANERDILAALGALRGRMAVLVISHQPSATVGADRVIALAGGRVIVSDFPAGRRP